MNDERVKRHYERHLVSKPRDADAEAAETQCWLDYAMSCGYLAKGDYTRLDQEYENLIGGLVKMMANPDPWCGPATLVKEEAAPYTSYTPKPPTSPTQP